MAGNTVSGPLIILRDLLTVQQCKDFVRHTGQLTEVDIDAIMHDNILDAVEQKYQMLLGVIKKNGYNVVSTFEDILKSMDLQDVAENFQKHVKERQASMCNGRQEEMAKEARCHGVDLLTEEYVDRPDEVKTILDLLKLRDQAGSSPVGVVDARGKQFEYKPTHIGIKGLGGIGKTTIAKAIAQIVCNEYHMDVFWLTISQKSDILRSFNTLHFYFTGHQESFPDIKAGQEWLREVTQAKELLLILDDVWSETDVIPFNVLGSNCRLLITTRNSQVITFNKAKPFPLGDLSSEQSREMLLRYAAMNADKIREFHLGKMFGEFQEVLKNHPLAIALIGSVLRQASHARDVTRRWERTLRSLKDRNKFWEKNAEKLKTESYSHSLNGAFDVSFDFLGVSGETEDEVRGYTQLQKRFVDFALFPEDTAIPAHVLKMLWRQDKASKRGDDSESESDDDGDDDDDDFDDSLLALKGSSLIHDAKSSGEEDCYELHDLVLQYAEYKYKKMNGKGSLEKRQKDLLNCYASSFNAVQLEVPPTNSSTTRSEESGLKCRPDTTRGLVGTTSDGFPWWNMDNDGYIYRHLMHHLLKAGGDQTASNLLVEYKWIKRKLSETDIGAVIADFEQYFKHLQAQKRGFEESTEMVYEALNFTARVIARDKNQLPFQLLGSLTETENLRIRHLVSEMKADELVDATFGLVPLTSCLTQPGGYLKRSIPDNKATVLCVAFTNRNDNKRMIAGLGTGGYKKARVLVIDKATGRESILGKESDRHEGLVFGLAIHPKDYFVITASFDMTLKVWPLDNEFESVHTLTGHDDNIYCVALSRDGTFAVSGAADRTIKKWDIEKKECVLTMRGHDKTIRQVCITRDGGRVVSGSEDETVRVWCLKSGQQLKMFDSRVKTVFQIAITNDGSKVIAVGDHERAAVMDLEDGELIHELKGHGCEIIACSVTDNDSHVFTGAADGRIRMWSLATGEEERVFQGHAERVRYIGLSKDGKAMASGSEDCSLKLWNCDPDNNKQVATQRGHGRAVSALSVKDDGSMVLSASHDNSVQLWELPAYRCVHTFHGHTDKITCLSISQQLCYGLSGSDDKTIILWDLQHKKQVCSPLRGHDYGVRALCAATVLGRNIMVSGSIDNTLIVWNLDTRLPTCKLTSQFYDVKDITVSNNDVIAAVGESVSKWSISEDHFTENNVRGRQSTIHKEDPDPDTSPCPEMSNNDTARQAEPLINGYDDEEYKSDTSVVSKHKHTFPIVERFDKNGFYLGWDEMSRIRVWDLDNEIESKIASGHEDDDLVTSLYLTPDNEILLCGSESGNVNLIGLYNTESPMGKLKRPELINAAVTTMCMLECEAVDDGPNSVMLFAGDQHGVISCWKTDDRESIYRCGRTPLSSIDISSLPSGNGDESSFQPLELEGAAEVGRLASAVSQMVGYVHDGTPMLISCCRGTEDHSIVILNVSTGQQLHKLSGHTRVITSLCFVEPTALLSASLDGTIRCWNLTSGECRVDHSRFGPECGVQCLTVTPDKRNYLIGSRKNVVEVHDIESGHKVGKDIQLGPKFNMKYLAVSQDGSKAISCYDDYTSELRDRADQKLLLSMIGHHNEWGNISCLGEHGRTVLSSTTHCGLKAWKTEDGHVLGSVGQRLANTADDGVEPKKTDGHTRMVTAVKIHKELILTGSYDKSVKVWKIGKMNSTRLQTSLENTFFFEHAVTALDVTKDNVVCVGLLNGLVCFLKLIMND